MPSAIRCLNYSKDPHTWKFLLFRGLPRHQKNAIGIRWWETKLDKKKFIYKSNLWKTWKVFSHATNFDVNIKYSYLSESEWTLNEPKSSFGEQDGPWGGIRKNLGGKLPPKEAQMAPLIKSVACYGGIFVFLFNNFFTKFDYFIFLGHVNFFWNFITYIHVNLEKSRLGAAASLGGGGGGGVAALPQKAKTASLNSE